MALDRAPWTMEHMVDKYPWCSRMMNDCQGDLHGFGLSCLTNHGESGSATCLLPMLVCECGAQQGRSSTDMKKVK